MSSLYSSHPREFLTTDSTPCSKNLKVTSKSMENQFTVEEHMVIMGLGIDRLPNKSEQLCADQLWLRSVADQNQGKDFSQGWKTKRCVLGNRVKDN